eukprot:15450427-Alexandrium_andersonii.AAC.1
MDGERGGPPFAEELHHAPLGGRVREPPEPQGRGEVGLRERDARPRGLPLRKSKKGNEGLHRQLVHPIGVEGKLSAEGPPDAVTSGLR